MCVDLCLSGVRYVGVCGDLWTIDTGVECKCLGHIACCVAIDAWGVWVC